MATTNTTNGITLKMATAYTRVFYYGTTGQTVSVSISKGGAGFGAPSGGATATEIAVGFYKIALSTADTNFLGDLAYSCTAGAGGPATWTDQVVGQLFTDLSITGTGLANISSNCKQGQPLNGFSFTMTSTTTGAPLTGLTVTATRYIGGWSPCVNTPFEIGFGDYAINLAGSDTNAPVVMYRFTAPAANDVNIVLITQT